MDEGTTIKTNEPKKNRIIEKFGSFIKNSDNNDKKKENNFLDEFFTYIETYLSNSDFNKEEINKELYLRYFLKLMFYDYIIFLPNKFFLKSYYLFKNKKNFLLYLEKYNVIYFTFEDKNLILSVIGYLNNFIKNAKEDIQKILIKKILIPNIDYLEKTYFEGRKHVLTKIIHQMKFKEIYFQDSIIEPNILYKKISFSNQELFLNLNQYSMKRVEYKLRSFCQIAEELGAELIDIKYNYIKNEKSDNDMSLNLNILNLGGKVSEEKNNKDEINLKFEYPSNHIHINLNKYHLINKIIKENQFLMSKEEFESDVELKYLIDARCTSFIQKYNTQFTVESCNFIEKKLYLEANKYGINFDSSFLKNHSINLSIYVEFFPLIENPQIIDGTNIHVMREGFLFLMRLIDEEIKNLNEKNFDEKEKKIEKRKIYRKLIQYIKSHLYSLENNWIDLNFSYHFQDNLTKIFKQMIDKNFRQDEFEDYIIKYFENHMGWSGFLNLRSTILKGDLSGLDKLSFVSTQYIDILIYKKTIIDNIYNYINEELKDEIYDYILTNINFMHHNKINFLYEKIKEEFLNKIKNIIIQVYRKSFYVYNGLSNNHEYENLRNIMYHLLVYNFENYVFDIIKEIDEESKNYRFYSKLDIMSFKSKISIWIDKILRHLNENKFFVKEELTPIKNDYIYDNNKICLIDEKINKQNVNKINKFKKIIDIKIKNLTSESPNSNQYVIICTTLIDRQRKYFVKYIIRYFQYYHKLDILFKYLNIKSENVEEVEYNLYNYICDYYSIHKLYSNYIAYRLFFSYNDFEEILNFINNNIKFFGNKQNLIKNINNIINDDDKDDKDYKYYKDDKDDKKVLNKVNIKKNSKFKGSYKKKIFKNKFKKKIKNKKNDDLKKETNKDLIIDNPFEHSYLKLINIIILLLGTIIKKKDNDDESNKIK